MPRHLPTLVFVALALAPAPAAARDPRPIQLDSAGPPPRFGIRFDPTETARAGGIAISEVLAGLPAEAAGLRAGDVLLSVDGRPMNEEDALGRLLAERGRGSALTCEFRRGNVAHRKIVVLETPRPSAVKVPEPKRAGGTPRPAAATAELGPVAGLPAAVPAESRPEGAASSRVATAACALAAVEEARRALAGSTPPTEEALARVRRLLDEAHAALAAAEGRASAPTPKALLDRANALAREGKTPVEVQAELCREFADLKIEIRSVPGRPAPSVPPVPPAPPAPRAPDAPSAAPAPNAPAAPARPSDIPGRPGSVDAFDDMDGDVAPAAPTSRPASRPK